MSGPVLFVSNGFGEDTIAAGIVEQLVKLSPGTRVLALPLVGEGKAYSSLGVEMVGPRQLMPSGGLIMAGWSNLLGDLRAGLWGHTFGQIRVLRQWRGRLGALVAVGDTYPVIMGAWFARRKVIMVGTAKSNYFYPYSFIERWLFRRHVSMVFARDEPTAARLRDQGVTALWVGNGMMDTMGITGQALPVTPGVPCIGLLPGSRQTAYRDLPVMLEAVRIMASRTPLCGALALSDSLNNAAIASSAARCGWTLQEAEGKLCRDGVEIWLLRGRFGDVIDQSVLVVGQAGTGNEQAVGLGKPVIAFDSDGRKPSGWYRARQKGLLGDSLAVVDRSSQAIAEEALRVLQDKAQYERMRRAGFERMGPPGASGKIAAHILSTLDQVPCWPTMTSGLAL